ncbi:uncharacterized protein LOC116253146 isoform X2 [Nymphaea colorata]|uniref:uncharacterized protein LOC116253146 isoform X2 n=1 Tax=Nymphaea colorata TaxID=210225 RepID=UPI00214E8282|nr:uncharacterized protein LOC116253146 isoform X2 [Nymphaea colorata]
MRAAARRLVDAVLVRRSHSLPASHHHCCIRSLRHAATTPRSSPTLPAASLLPSWSANQSRGAKVLGTDIRLGNIIQRKGRIYQVLKAQHTQHGRGGATIQVELRDVDSGNKVTERFRTDEAIERVFVEEKSFTFLYQEGESVMIMEPSTFEQLEVSKELFGKGVAYLKGRTHPSRSQVSPPWCRQHVLKPFWQWSGRNKQRKSKYGLDMRFLLPMPP